MVYLKGCPWRSGRGRGFIDASLHPSCALYIFRHLPSSKATSALFSRLLLLPVGRWIVLFRSQLFDFSRGFGGSAVFVTSVATSVRKRRTDDRVFMNLAKILIVSFVEVGRGGEEGVDHFSV